MINIRVLASNSRLFFWWSGLALTVLLVVSGWNFHLLVGNVSVRFQPPDKWLRCLYNIPKQVLSTSLSQHRQYLACSTPYPKLSSTETGLHWLWYNPVILATPVLSLLASGSPISPPPLLTWHCSVCQACLVWTLPEVSASGYALPYIYYKNPNPLGDVFSSS